MKKQKTYFENELTDPENIDGNFPSFYLIFKMFAASVFFLAFFGIFAKLVFYPPGIVAVTVDVLGNLLAQTAQATGNYHFGDLMTGLALSVMILTIIGLMIHYAMNTDKRTDEHVETISENVYLLEERFTYLAQELATLKQRLVIEPAMARLVAANMEGVIDRKTGEILQAGTVTESDLDLYEPEEVIVRAKDGYCPICEEFYETRDCPECHNIMAPGQADPDCELCHGSGVYGTCLANHSEVERRWFNRGPRWWKFYQWKQRTAQRIKQAFTLPHLPF